MNGPLLQSLGLLPRACQLVDIVEQTGGYTFSIKGKKTTKLQLVKTGAQLSILNILGLHSQFHCHNRRDSSKTLPKYLLSWRSIQICSEMEFSPCLIIHYLMEKASVYETAFTLQFLMFFLAI